MSSNTLCSACDSHAAYLLVGISNPRCFRFSFFSGRRIGPRYGGRSRRMNLERLLKAARELEQALYNAENRFDSNSTTQKADIHHLRPSNITSPESWEIRFQNDPQNPIKTIAESKPWFPIIRQQPEASQSHSLPRPNSPAKYRMSIAGENKVATTRPKLPDDVSAEQRLRAMERVLRAQEHSLVDCFTFEKSDKLMSLLQRWRSMVFELLLQRCILQDQLNVERESHRLHVDQLERKIAGMQFDTSVADEKLKLLKLEADHYKSIAKSLEAVNKELLSTALQQQAEISSRRECEEAIKNRLMAHETKLSQKHLILQAHIFQRIQHFNRLLDVINDKVMVALHFLPMHRQQRNITTEYYLDERIHKILRDRSVTIAQDIQQRKTSPPIIPSGHDSLLSQQPEISRQIEELQSKLEMIMKSDDASKRKSHRQPSDNVKAATRRLERLESLSDKLLKD